MTGDPRAAPRTSASRPVDRSADVVAEPVVDVVVLGEVARQLAGLRYGSVEIVVHEGAVTQIERREKIRFPLSNTSPPAKRD